MPNSPIFELSLDDPLLLSDQSSSISAQRAAEALRNAKTQKDAGEWFEHCRRRRATGEPGYFGQRFAQLAGNLAEVAARNASDPQVAHLEALSEKIRKKLSVGAALDSHCQDFLNFLLTEGAPTFTVGLPLLRDVFEGRLGAYPSFGIKTPAAGNILLEATSSLTCAMDRGDPQNARRAAFLFCTLITLDEHGRLAGFYRPATTV